MMLISRTNRTHINRERNRTMSASKVLLGTMIGMATGVALGVLFAPDKGSNTRRRISRQGSRYMGAIQDTATECVESIEETMDRAKETAVDLADRVKSAVDSLLGHEPEKHSRPSK
jgi:gas vesicle protein